MDVPEVGHGLKELKVLLKWSWNALVKTPNDLLEFGKLVEEVLWFLVFLKRKGNESTTRMEEENIELIEHVNPVFLGKTLR